MLAKKRNLTNCETKSVWGRDKNWKRDIPGRKEKIGSKNGTNIDTKNRLENYKIMWVPQ